jgi:exopolyphosphatase/pppGpp-phosphohydrolase
MFTGRSEVISPQTLFSKFPLKQTILADLGGGSLEISLLESEDKSKSSRNNFLYSIDIGTLRLKKMNPVLQQLESRLTEELNQLYSVNPQDSSHLILTGGNAKIFARLFTQISTKYVSDKSNTNLTENWLSMNWNEFMRIEQIFQQQSAKEQQHAGDFDYNRLKFSISHWLSFVLSAKNLELNA